MPDSDRTMYRWRKLTDAQREAVLRERKQQQRPWHSPPHYASDTSLYHLTAACFEHRSHIGRSPDRMWDFEEGLLNELRPLCVHVFAWCILPNHYHLLVQTCDIKKVLRELGRMHGRTSYKWNREEGRTGRQVWFNAVETAMKSERHFYATLNYVLHNAVHHGYVELWTDWPYCSAREYLDSIGRVEATRIWHEYPLYDYGALWDPPEL